MRNNEFPEAMFPPQSHFSFLQSQIIVTLKVQCCSLSLASFSFFTKIYFYSHWCWWLSPFCDHYQHNFFNESVEQKGVFRDWQKKAKNWPWKGGGLLLESLQIWTNLFKVVWRLIALIDFGITQIWVWIPAKPFYYLYALGRITL